MPSLTGPYACNDFLSSDQSKELDKRLLRRVHPARFRVQQCGDQAKERTGTEDGCLAKNKKDFGR